MVQVFAKTSHPLGDQQGVWDDEDLNGYQLMNEVGSGGTLSSLFTILSLFTEDVKISWNEDQERTESPSSFTSLDVNAIALVPSRSGNTSRPNSKVSPLQHEKMYKNRPSSASSNASTVHSRSVSNSRLRNGFMSPTLEESYMPATFGDTNPSVTNHRASLVARAVEDTTLAVIPAEGFRRLTKKFPKATSHIVQGTP